MTDLQTFNTEDFQTYTLWISVATLKYVLYVYFVWHTCDS